MTESHRLGFIVKVICILNVVYYIEIKEVFQTEIICGLKCAEYKIQGKL